MFTHGATMPPLTAFTEFLLSNSPTDSIEDFGVNPAAKFALFGSFFSSEESRDEMPLSLIKIYRIWKILPCYLIKWDYLRHTGVVVSAVFEQTSAERRLAVDERRIGERPLGHRRKIILTLQSSGADAIRCAVHSSSLTRMKMYCWAIVDDGFSRDFSSISPSLAIFTRFAICNQQQSTMKECKNDTDRMQKMNQTTFIRQ